MKLLLFWNYALETGTPLHVHILRVKELHYLPPPPPPAQITRPQYHQVPKKSGQDTVSCFHHERRDSTHGKYSRERERREISSLQNLGTAFLTAPLPTKRRHKYHVNSPKYVSGKSRFFSKYLEKLLNISKISGFIFINILVITSKSSLASKMATQISAVTLPLTFEHQHPPFCRKGKR